MTAPLRIGTLGAAAITPTALVTPARDTADVVVAAIAARDPARAAAFAREHGIATVHDSYDAVIADPTLDAIYVPLPISHHHEYTLKALRAGKHVLCEKAMARNAGEAAEMAEVARQCGRVLVEAFHYRYHPVFERALAIVDSGVLGALRRIEARFMIGTPPADDIRMHYATGGGATMDIGCYPMSWLRHITRQEPEVMAARATLGNPGVDLRLEVDYALAGGATATTLGAMDAPNFAADLVVEGSGGRLKVLNPLAPQFGHRIELTVDGTTTTEELTRRSTYAFQLDAFVDAVRHGTRMPTDADDAVRQMRLIDAAYRAAGMQPR